MNWKIVRVKHMFLSELSIGISVLAYAKSSEMISTTKLAHGVRTASSMVEFTQRAKMVFARVIGCIAPSFLKTSGAANGEHFQMYDTNINA